MQPLDVGVHRALREYLHAQFARKASLRQDISKQNLLATVWPAIRQAMSQKNILAGFRKSMFPELSELTIFFFNDTL